MICDKCKKELKNETILNYIRGFPNGVTWELKNGQELTLCTKCIKKLGSLNEIETKNFFKEIAEELKIKYKKEG